jgi:ferredoxin
VCLGDVYGGTFELLGENLPRLGIDTTFLTAGEADQLPDVLSDRTRIVFFETRPTPTSTSSTSPRSPPTPSIDGCDICVKICPKGAMTLQDNHKATLFDPDGCLSCYACVQQCPVNAIS